MITLRHTERQKWIEEQLATNNLFELLNLVEVKLRKAFELFSREPEDEDKWEMEWGVVAAGQEGVSEPHPRSHAS